MHDRPILILSYHIKLHTSVPIPWTTGWLIFKKESIIVWGRETVLYRISLNLTIYKSQKTVRRTKNYLSPSYHLAYTGIVNVLQQCIIYIFGTCCSVVCDCLCCQERSYFPTSDQSPMIPSQFIALTTSFYSNPFSLDRKVFREINLSNSNSYHKSLVLILVSLILVCMSHPHHS